MLSTIPLFIPIVTTYTVSSLKMPLEHLMTDSRRLAGTFLHYYEKMGFDCFPILGESTFNAEAFGCRIGYHTHEPLVIDPLHFSTREAVDQHPVADLSCCRTNQVYLGAVKRISGETRRRGPVIASSTAPLTTVSQIIGLENMLRQMIRDPGVILALVDKVTDLIIRYSRELLNAGAHMIFVADPVASPALVSPQMFRTFALPGLKRLMSAIPCPTILHICGDIIPIIHDMMEIEFTILSLDQCIRVKKVRDLLGKDPVLGGNIDPGHVLFDKTPDAVAEASRQCFKEGGPENFVLMPGCTIVPGTPVDNIRAMMKAAREVRS